jgi:sulfotransferase family protein
VIAVTQNPWQTGSDRVHDLLLCPDKLTAKHGERAGVMQAWQQFMDRHWKNLSSRSLRLTKTIYQFAKIRQASKHKTILFIFGCQRSGTTLLTEIFERDFDNTKVYGEFSPVSAADKTRHIRLNPLHLVKARIDNDRPSLIILKPLVESQNAVKLLNYFDNSKALWVYRHYRDVVLSHLQHWNTKNGINNLRPIVRGQRQNWRAENISAYTERIVQEHFSEDMNPYDAGALFWFVRNRLFFEMNLTDNPNVMTCKYDNLIDDPMRTIDNIYKFVGYRYPSDKLPLHIYADSKGRGKNLKLSRDIEILCNDMLNQLDVAHDLKQHSSTLHR